MYVGNVAMLECWNLILYLRLEYLYVLYCQILEDGVGVGSCTCILGFKWIKYWKSACVCCGTAVRKAVPQENLLARACQQARAARAISLLPGPVQDRSGPVRSGFSPVRSSPVLGPAPPSYSVLGPGRSGPVRSDPGPVTPLLPRLLPTDPKGSFLPSS